MGKIPDTHNLKKERFVFGSRFMAGLQRRNSMTEEHGRGKLFTYGDQEAEREKKS